VTVQAFTVDDSSQITTDIKIASDAEAGLRDISVTTPGGVATLANAFTVEEAPSGTPAWLWAVIAVAALAAVAGGFFLFFFLPRRKRKTEAS